MINTCLSVSVENNYLEPFDDRIEILFDELELATKWQRPSVLLAVYSSEYVRADADNVLEDLLHKLGQSAYHIKIKDPTGADVCLRMSELTDLENVVFFVEGLRWGAAEDTNQAYQALNNRLEFFIENSIRVVFWLTEKEATDLAHFAPDYWTFRHRVIEFVDPPKPDQISPQVLESTWQWTGEFNDTTDDLDAKIALRTALLTDLPPGNESTAARAHLLLTLGILHWRRGDYERATRFLNTAIDMAARLEDDHFEALCFNAIALVQTNLGRLEEAIQAYQNAISLAPEQIFPWNNLGRLYRKLGRNQEAMSAFQKSIDQNEADAVAWNGLGDLYRETGRNADAIFAYQKAIQYSPDYAHSWSGLGNSHLEEGRIDDALAAHQKAIELDPRAVNSWIGLGNIYRQQGDSEKAEKSYRTALELEPKNALAWNEFGNLHYCAGAMDEAMHSYQKSIEFNHPCGQTYSNQASIYILKGLHAAAIPLLLKGLELSSDEADSISLWNKLGEAYRHIDDYENAIAAYRKADQLTAESAITQHAAPSTAPDLTATPVEALPEQTLTPVDSEPFKEEPLPVELITPDLVSMPRQSILAENTEADPAGPDAEFVDWLDGLASVLPASLQTDADDADESAAPDGERLDDDDFELETGYQAYPLDQSIQPDQPESGDEDELSREVADQDILSSLPFQGNDLVGSDQSTQPTQPATEPERYAENGNPDDQAETQPTIYNETVELPGLVESDPDGQAGQSQGLIDEKNAQIWNELGNIYYNTGAFDEAMHAFEMAIQLDPANGWSYNNLASIFIHQKNYADAIPLYEKGLALLDDYKDKALLWNRMGDAYRRMDRHDQATTAYRKAIELNPENVSLLTRARFSLLGNLRV